MNFLSNIDKIIELEVQKALKVVLENRETSGSEERERQKKAATDLEKRNLRSSDSKEEVQEAEEDSEEDKEEPPKKREDRTGGKGTADSKKAKTPASQDFKNPTIDSVIDKVNVIRGGGSLKDSEVKKRFDAYFNSLTLQEKQALLIYLTGMAQVLVGSKSGADALDPGEIGLRVKSQAKDGKSIKKPEEEKVSSSKSQGPIVVGESQDRSDIYKVLLDKRIR